ncbi:MAG: glycoside hydrolase family 31 protein [Lentisphaeria bacterium]|nr:glycoside hydrolase family 31 protein [Lentisphaeria bacterium]
MFRPDLITEPEKIIRSSVVELRLRRSCSAFLEFDLFSTEEKFGFASSADPAMNERGNKKKYSKQSTLRIDVFENSLRVRFCDATQVPENELPIVIALPPTATAPAEISETDTGYIWNNGSFELSFRKNDGRMECRHNGRKIVTVGGSEKNYFYHWDAYSTGICRIIDSGEPLAVEKFSFSANEAIYGFGETFGKLNKNGETIHLDISDALGVTTPRCYKNVPFFMSSCGYGAFFNDSCRMRFDVGSRSRCDIQAVLDCGKLDYFLFFGTFKEILGSYTAMTGRAPMLPEWSFGFWQSKLTYKSADEILEVSRQLHDNGIPCDVLHLDTGWFEKEWLCDLEFDRKRFPHSGEWLRELKKRGIRLSVWQIPYLPEGTRLFERLKAAGGFARTADGEIYNIRFCLAEDFKGEVVGIVDYTNPETVRIMDEEFGRLMTVHGVDVIKTDFGESIPDDAVFCNGMTGKEMHNLYPLYYNDAVFKITQKYTASGLVWGRSAWAGGQRYPLQWGGDNSSNFDNMLPQLGGGLSLGMSGFTFWSQDIGGFLGEMGGKLLIRWMQLGAFLSHCRVHGYGDREIFKRPEQEKLLCREAIRLRYRLMPYLIEQSKQAAADGLPVLRSLVLEFENDFNTRNITDQFLWGDSIMVAPVMTEEDERDVYFPAGRWVDFFTGEEIYGPVWKHISCPLEYAPVYLREGAIVPVAEVKMTVPETLSGDITHIVCRSSRPGKFQLGNMVYLFDGREHTLTVEGKKTAAELR